MSVDEDAPEFHLQCTALSCYSRATHAVFLEGKGTGFDKKTNQNSRPSIVPCLILVCKKCSEDVSNRLTDQKVKFYVKALTEMVGSRKIPLQFRSVKIPNVY
jgi:hypothetical protein